MWELLERPRLTLQRRYSDVTFSAMVESIKDLTLWMWFNHVRFL